MHNADMPFSEHVTFVFFLVLTFRGKTLLDLNYEMNTPFVMIVILLFVAKGLEVLTTK